MHEVLGKGTFNTTNIDVQDYASLLLMDSKDDLSVTFEKNNIFNFTFISKYSALIAKYYSYGNFTFKDNTVFNVGYIAKLSSLKVPYLNMNTERQNNLPYTHSSAAQT